MQAKAGIRNPLREEIRRSYREANRFYELYFKTTSLFAHGMAEHYHDIARKLVIAALDVGMTPQEIASNGE